MKLKSETNFSVLPAGSKEYCLICFPTWNPVRLVFSLLAPFVMRSAVPKVAVDVETLKSGIECPDESIIQGKANTAVPFDKVILV